MNRESKIDQIFDIMLFVFRLMVIACGGAVIACGGVIIASLLALLFP
jgi:hypothetical protein